MSTTTMSHTHSATMVKMVLDAWNMQNNRFEKLIGELSDEQLSAHVAPGRNSGTYIFGHLAAVNDRLLETMGWGSRLHTELDQPYLLNPDNNDHPKASVAELRSCWNEINAEINKHIATMQTEDWFTRHMSVSEEDFAKEPHRNRLNLLMSRAIHLSNHLGQMIFLMPK